MNFKKNLLLALGLGLCVSSCSNNEEIYTQNLIENENVETVLTFQSRKSFNDIINFEATVDPSTKGTELSINDLSEISVKLPKGKSLYEKSDYREKMRKYVPNEKFARLLNENGEVIVNDTIFRITPEGTYYCHINNKKQFDKLFSENETPPLGEDLGKHFYKITELIYRYDTYHYRKDYRDDLDDDVVALEQNNNPTLTTRSYGATPAINTFQEFPAIKQNIFGFLIGNIIGTRAHTVNFSSNNDRRVRGNFYDNDHIVYREIGIEAWTDKKNWIGWSKTNADQLWVGWKDVIIEYDLGQKWRNVASSIKAGQSRPQYIPVPGTTYLRNATTFIIPNFNGTEFQKIVNKGSLEVFKMIKGYLENNVNESSYNNSPAALILSDTKMYLYIKDESTRKYNEDYYCHVFANSWQMALKMDESTFSGDWVSAAISLIKGSIEETSKLAKPTLVKGDSYVAAYFYPEWQGMRVKK